MSNIAEGFSRTSEKDFAHFSILHESVLEVQSLLYVALDVGYMEKNEFERLYKLTDETVSLISGFTSYLRKSHISV